MDELILVYAGSKGDKSEEEKVKDFLQKRFPLILVVGREANSNGEIDNSIGLYNFRNYGSPKGWPGCVEWNVAYKIVAEANDKRCWELKKECENSESSIIAFADISPKPMEYKNTTYTQRIKEREKIPPEDFEKHVKNILSNELMDRVELVIFHGIDEKYGFKNALEAKETIKEKYNGKYMEIKPFFSFRFWKIIENELKDKYNEKKIIRNIYKKWQTNTSKQ